MKCRGAHQARTRWKLYLVIGMSAILAVACQAAHPMETEQTTENAAVASVKQSETLAEHTVNISSNNYKTGYFFGEASMLVNDCIYDVQTNSSFSYLGNALQEQYKDCISSDISGVCGQQVLFETHNETGKGETCLYLVDIGENEAKKVKEWSGKAKIQPVGDEIMIDHQLYFAIRERETSTTEDGWVQTDDASCALYCFDFDSETLDLIYQSDEYADAGVLNVLYNDGKIYMGAEFQTKSFEEAGLTEREYHENFDQYMDQRVELLGMSYKHFIYDIEEQTLYDVPIEKNSGEIYIQGFWNGYLYAVIDQTQMWSFQIKDGTAALVKEDDSIHHYALYQSADFMLYGEYDQQSKMTWYMLDASGQGREGHLPKNDMNLVVEYESSETLYIAWKPQKNNSTDDEWECAYVSREEFKKWFEEEKGTEIQSETPCTQEPSASPEGSSASTEQAVLTESSLQTAYPDKEVLTWVYNDFVTISAEVNLAYNDELDQQGAEYVVLFKQLSSDCFENSINASLADDPPDIISAGLGAGGTLQGTAQAYENDWFLPLDEYLQSEEGAQLRNAVPKALWDSSSVNGAYLGISTRLPFATDYTYYVDTQLLEQCGLTAEECAEYDFSELGDILSLVGADVDRLVLEQYDSAADYIYGYSTVVEPMGNQTDAMVVSYLGGDDIVNLFEQPDAVEYLRAVRKYHEKGYIKFLGEGSEEDANERFFIYVGMDDRFDDGYSERIIQNLKANYPATEEVTVIHAGTYPLSTSYNSIAGVCKASAHRELALQALTDVMTEQTLSDLLLYGVFNQDAVMDSAGRVENDSVVWSYSMYFGNTLISTPTSAEPVDKQQIFSDILGEMKTSPMLGVYLDLQDQAETIAVVQDIVEEYRGLFEGTYEDVDQTLEKLNDALYSAGLKEVLEEANLQLRAAGR